MSLRSWASPTSVFSSLSWPRAATASLRTTSGTPSRACWRMTSISASSGGESAPARNAAQQIEEVAAEVPLLLADRRAERARETLESRIARRRAVDLEQEQHEPAAVALLLAGQRLEQALGLIRREELQDPAQLGLVARLLGELLELLRVERLAQLSAGDLGAAGVHLLLGDETLGELQHLDGLGQRALVEPLDARLDHLVETLRGLGRVLRVRDDAAHRADRSGFVGRRPRRVAAAGGATHPGTESARARKRLSVPVSRPSAFRRASVCSSSSFDCELRAAKASASEAGAGSEEPRPGRRRGGRGFRESARGFQSLEKERDAFQAPQRVARDRVPAPRSPRPPRPAPTPTRGRAAGHGRRPHLPMNLLDRRNGRGRRRRAFSEAAQVLGQDLPIFGRADGHDDRLQLPEVGVHRLLRDELELAHHVDLLEGVEEVVRDREAAAAAAPVLRGGPGPDRGQDRLRRVFQEQLDRVRHDQGRQTVGEVLLKLEDRFLELGVRRLPGHEVFFALG